MVKDEAQFVRSRRDLPHLNGHGANDLLARGRFEAILETGYGQTTWKIALGADLKRFARSGRAARTRTHLAVPTSKDPRRHAFAEIGKSNKAMDTNPRAIPAI